MSLKCLPFFVFLFFSFLVYSFLMIPTSCTDRGGEFQGLIGVVFLQLALPW